MYGQVPPYQTGQHGPPHQPPLPPSIAASTGSAASFGSNSSFDSNVLGLLRNMEREDLQNLSDPTIESLISDDADLNKMQEIKLTEGATNRSLAEDSLKQQSRLEQRRRELITAHKKAAELVQQHRELANRLAGGGGQAESLETLHSLLQSACLEAEESGESILDRFLSQQLSLTDFVSAYTQTRQLYHTRRAKADKVTEISNQRIVQASAAYRTTSTAGAPLVGGGPFVPPSMPPPMPPPLQSYYFPAPGNQPPYYGGRP